MLDFATKKINDFDKTIEKRQRKQKIYKAMVNAMQDLISTYKDKSEKEESEDSKLFYEEIAYRLEKMTDRYFENLEEV